MQTETTQSTARLIPPEPEGGLDHPPSFVRIVQRPIDEFIQGWESLPSTSATTVETVGVARPPVRDIVIADQRTWMEKPADPLFRQFLVEPSFQHASRRDLAKRILSQLEAAVQGGMGLQRLYAVRVLEPPDLRIPRERYAVDRLVPGAERGSLLFDDFSRADKAILERTVMEILAHARAVELEFVDRVGHQLRRVVFWLSD